ncbi:actin cytoskeleton-regulatory complex protein PAN1 [Haplochromis burtoni]|uniref:actin cytoskeleton-regulatory complex protein PAN1 n=1 Tax=Haplochromis burtoni TaxID=8153 RepID=UPI0003BC87A6|nr:actin cytoskeleton-regulatory complex protein PAN1 [Haplochromis burtoni]
MARRGPGLLDCHLDFSAGRLDYVVERPAEEGLPEVIRILDDSLQSTTSSREAQDTDTQRISEGEYGEYFTPLSPSPSSDEAPDADDGEQQGEYGEYPPYLPVDDEEVSEQTDNSSDWNDSEEWGDWLSDDSGYDTMDERDDSPLIREHPPEPFWHDWQHPIAPGAAPIAMPPFGQANAPLFPRVVAPVGDPPAAPPSAHHGSPPTIIHS